MIVFNIDTLLQSITGINKKYENIEAVTGEKFNIFRLLKAESQEVRTHSAFLAELLNPNGSHGQKRTFLKLFLERFNIPDFSYAEGSHLTVLIEEVFDNGRIDIVIKNSLGQVIVIENKIYAVDQPRQLARYKENYPNCHLIYLTLFGSEPATDSIEKENKTKLIKGREFYTKSYKTDILGWLTECRKEASTFPILRETLTQYIILIKSLTNQTMNDQQKAEVINSVIYSREKIEAAQNIAEAWTDIKYAIIARVIEELKAKTKEQTEILFGFDEDCRVGAKETGFWFYKKDWKYCIYFMFTMDFEEMIIGIDRSSNNYEKNFKLTRELFNELATIAKGSSTEYFMWYTNFIEWSTYGWNELDKIIPIIQEKRVKLFFAIENLMTKSIEFKSEWMLKPDPATN